MASTTINNRIKEVVNKINTYVFLSYKDSYGETKDLNTDYMTAFRNICFDLHVLCESANMDGEHGLEHALIVVEHTIKALDCSEYPETLSHQTLFSIILASLLHDADDHKFFDNTYNKNSNRIMRRNLTGLEHCKYIVDLTIKLIELVSCSKNGNSIRGINYDWELYPRLADRLEAIGEIGIKRCFAYSDFTNRPRFNDKTPRSKSEDEVMSNASYERFYAYLNGKKSETAIDHFYDKLIRITEFGPQTKNLYLLNEAFERKEIMINFLIGYGFSE